MTPEAEAQGQATRDRLALENAAHGTSYYLLIDEAQTRELMAGHVPDVVREMARTFIEWEFDIAKEVRPEVAPMKKKRQRKNSRAALCHTTEESVAQPSAAKEQTCQT